MKKTFAKVFALVLVLALGVVGLASCAQGFVADSFKIGATGPLTGDASSYGVSVQQGAKLAVKHLNEKGNVKFSFVILDDMATSEDAATNYDTLVDQGMQLSLGGVTSGSGKAFSEKATGDGLFTMTPSGSADNVIDNLKYSFRLCFGDPDQGSLAADEIKAGGFTNVGALYDTSDAYSSGIYTAFEARMAELGIQYNAQTFDKNNKTDFNTQANALKDCDVIFMPFYYQEAALVIKQAVAKGFDGLFFGCDGFDGLAELVEGVENPIKYITPFDVNSTEQKVKDFVEAYKAEYDGQLPDQFAADAYDVVMVLAKALEKSGTTDYTLTASQIGDILYSTITAADFSYDGLTGNGMTWDATGRCTKGPKIVSLN